MKPFLILPAVMVAALLALSAPGANAQGYASKSIKLIVPYSPGGGTDILARVYAQKLGERLGQSVVVENRAGADGVIGTEAVVRAPPDGYTLAIVTPAHAINPSVKATMPFDTAKELAPITLLAATPFVVVVGPQLPAKNATELIALAKAQPGKLSFGSSDPSSRLAGELFKSLSGTDMLNVPYKGGAQIMNDLLGGHVAVGFTSVPTATQFYKAGTLRVLGVAGTKRSSSMPDVPTLAEQGIAGYDSAAWYGIVAPAGTPKDIVARLNAELVAITKEPEVAARLQQLGAEAVGSSPEEFDAFIKRELTRSAQLVKQANIKPE